MEWLDTKNTEFYVIVGTDDQVLTDEHFVPYIFWDITRAEDFIYGDTHLYDVRIVPASLILR